LLPRIIEGCQKSLDLVDELIIVGVENNSKILNAPDNTQKLELNLSVLASQDEITWIVNGKKVGLTQSNQPMLLTDLGKGDYSIMVFNSQGQKGRIEFEVL